jgi:hypothetical protein
MKLRRTGHFIFHLSFLTLTVARQMTNDKWQMENGKWKMENKLPNTLPVTYMKFGVCSRDM